MTKKDIIKMCLEMEDSYEDYPFDEITAVIRNKSNKKMFALVGTKDEKLYINLKCIPAKADFLRKVYKDVIPGYHMNKTHWNTIYVHGDVPVD
ncbi:MAG: MmcQ/YjbR family DNA-binding protein [Proteocatella sp.]